jgi:hypothetical protein
MNTDRLTTNHHKKTSSEGRIKTGTARTASLSAQESRRFLEALGAPFEPNAKLKAALTRVANQA